MPQVLEDIRTFEDLFVEIDPVSEWDIRPPVDDFGNEVCSLAYLRAMHVGDYGWHLSRMLACTPQL